MVVIIKDAVLFDTTSPPGWVVSFFYFEIATFKNINRNQKHIYNPVLTSMAPEKVINMMVEIFVDFL